ncbi:MAG: decaprenyl-phosphate phosphoribosyltransferase [bacterium]
MNMDIGAWAQALRPRQWAKNLLLFAGVLFADRFLEPELLGRAFLAFLLFNGLSSAGYLLNDANDVDRDRRHPVKRNRPMARGAIPVSAGRAAGLSLGLVCLALAFLLLPHLFGLLSALYFAMSWGYSRVFKTIPILEMLVVALGYVLRVAAGALAAMVHITPWLLLCTFLLALVIVIGKRRAEMQTPETREVLSAYSIALLDQFLAASVGATLVAYCFYTFQGHPGPAGEQNPPNPYLMITIPSVVFGLFRYLYLIFREDKGGTPDEDLVRDVPSVINVGLWVGLVVTAFWLHTKGGVSQ